eukprot:gene2351-2819_t
MSGTSMDGIDAVLYEIKNEKHKILSRLNTEYDQFSKTLLKFGEYISKLNKGKIEDIKGQSCEIYFPNYFESRIGKVEKTVFQEELEKHKKYLETIKQLEFSTQSELNLNVIIKLSTYLHYFAVKTLLENYSEKNLIVDVIGYHGQTWYHNPNLNTSLQIGDGNLLSELTSISVVNDFRSQDVSNGGQGAPLAPLYHGHLISNLNLQPACIINIGGIANISAIFDKNRIIGFDTGPGNNLIDQFVKYKTNGLQEMDEDGEYGLKGKVDEKVFGLLKKKSCMIEIQNLMENYLNLEPPKSLDISNLYLLPEVKELDLIDGCATLSLFTVWCIIDSFESAERGIQKNEIYGTCKQNNDNFSKIKTWILAGGGWKNQSIFRYFEDSLLTKFGSDLMIKNIDNIEGLSSDTLEAEIFAKFAWDVLNEIPTSLPSTTGVSKPTSGGNVHFSKIPSENVKNTIKFKSK